MTLDDALLTELLRLSGESTKTAAVTAAVREQIRRAKLKKLADMLGHVEVDEAAVRDARRLDLDRAGWLTELWGKKRGKRR